jgi:hypothetical protein
MNRLGFSPISEAFNVEGPGNKGTDNQVNQNKSTTQAVTPIQQLSKTDTTFEMEFVKLMDNPLFDKYIYNYIQLI